MKVYLDTIGCRLNQSEIETYANQFSSAGHELVGTMGEADMMVVNTCTVTAAAASDSRQKIRQAHKAGIEKIVVTGCLSTLQPEEIINMPGVSKVIPNRDKDSLVSEVLKANGQTFDLESLAGDIRDAEEDLADCKDDTERDRLARHLDQLRALQAALTQ